MDEKSRYIDMIRERYPEDKYGEHLIKLMDFYNASNLQQLTLAEIKDYLHILSIEK